MGQVPRYGRAGLKYLLYTPGEEKDLYPAIFYLHGAGERGNDVNKVKKHGPPKLVEEGKEFPFIIVSPQCPFGEYWRSMHLISFVDEVINEYPVDRKRIYLTGNSMGGYGTWHMALKYPDMFAAIAPVCGGGDPSQAYKIKHLPVWAFHGMKDDIVPFYESEMMVKSLEEIDGNVKFTAYPDLAHDSWTPTYNNDQLYQWFLEQEK